MRYLLATLSMIFFLGTAEAQYSFQEETSLENSCYSDKQIKEIKSLLKQTKHSLSNKLENAENDEFYSRAIITDSYKFAKNYAQILDLSSVPFDMLISSTTFVECWASNEFGKAGGCWKKHIEVIDAEELAKIF